ncbi:MAG: hypothetical protein HY268_06020 [Deltaproteobacteria bacterium]|nr:hypothetical protein [Deltaproteobacteria bacterium]
MIRVRWPKLSSLLARQVRTSNAPLWALALVVVTVSGQAADSDEWPLGRFQYEVRRSAQPIGVHTVAVTAEGERFVVAVTEWLDVNGWYGSYCHRANRREVWSAGKLLRYDSAMVGACSGLVWGWDQVRNRKSCVWANDRTPIRISAQQTEGKLLIARHNLTTGASVTEALDTTLSANFLNPRIREEPRVQLLDPIIGEPRAMTILELGAESIALPEQTVETQKYQYTYLDDSTDTYYVWFNGEGLMVRMKNITDEVTFTLMPKARFAAQSGPSATNAACSQDFPPLIDIPGAGP